MLYPVLKIICNQRNHILLLQISGAVYEHHIHSAHYTGLPKKYETSETTVMQNLF